MGESRRRWEAGGVEAAGASGWVTRGGGAEGEGEREVEGQGPVGRLPSWAGPPAANLGFFLIFYFSHMMYKYIINY